MTHARHMLGVDAAPARVITIRVKNAQQLAEGRGGIAWLAANVIPATVESEVYAEMAKQFGQQLKDNGVDAEVSVVDASGLEKRPAWAPTDTRAFGVGALVGGGLAGLGMMLWKWIK